MLPVNYHHLYYFWMTAKTGSITQACDKLLLAQPTLSLQISQLEKFIGKKLLHRSRQGVSLTPEGRIAFEYCERIFSYGESMISAIRQGETTLPPILRLGASKSIARETILEVIDAIQDWDSQIQTTIVTGPSQELQERLEKHALDLVISDRDFSSFMGKGFMSRLIGALPVHFVATPRLKRTTRHFPTRGQEVVMLLRTPENPLRKSVEEYAARWQMRLSIAAETEDPDLIRILAIRDKGVAALNALAIRDDLREGRLVLLQSHPTGIKEYVWMISRSMHVTTNEAVQKALQGLMSRFRISTKTPSFEQPKKS